MATKYLFFWQHKTASDNAWRPEPGGSPTKYRDNILPLALQRADIHAAIVDVFPFIMAAGALTHVRQIHDFGFTAPASVFRNIRTMTAMHRTTLFMTPVIVACQIAGVQYRDFIPRWAHARERRRDEEEVRKHVDFGMAVGAAGYFTRIAFKVGLRYWSPLDVIVGGAITDLLHREYLRAHNL